MSLIKSNKNYNRFGSLLDEFMDRSFFNFNSLNDLDLNNSPKVNIIENDKSYIYELTTPGFKKEDLKLSVDNNTLTISASTENNEDRTIDMYHKKQYVKSSFTKQFNLSNSVDASKIDAVYKDGILKIEIPKVENKSDTKIITIK